MKYTSIEGWNRFHRDGMYTGVLMRRLHEYAKR